MREDRSPSVSLINAGGKNRADDLVNNITKATLPAIINTCV